MTPRLVLPFLVLAASLTAVPAYGAALPDACSTSGATTTCTWTSGSGSVVVPTGVTSVHVEVVGAAGGHAWGDGDYAGGQGARVVGELATMPGANLLATVGGHGGDGGANGGGAGGSNGGGGGPAADEAVAGGGGGASDIRSDGTDLAARVVVAGGGGGSSYDGPGGAAGALPNGSGEPGQLLQFNYGDPGAGGTPKAGGAGAFGGTSDGTAGQGGRGYHSTFYDRNGTFRTRAQGGSGGGGLYGGGGAGDSAGGGAGSSLIPAGGTIAVADEDDEPHVTISWTATSKVSLSASAPSFSAGGSVTLTSSAPASYSIAPEGWCSGAVCTATRAGRHVVTATSASGTATVAVDVTPAAATRLLLTPHRPRVRVGRSVRFTAQSVDAYGNVVRDVTANATFGLAGPGTCRRSGPVCTPRSTGRHLVVATKGKLTGRTVVRAH